MFRAAVLLFLFVPLAFAQDKPDVPGLIKQLKDKDALVRLKAAKTLGSLGAAAKEALPALKEATTDSDEDVREVAKRAIAKIGDEITEDPTTDGLLKNLRSKDSDKKLKALTALGALGRKAKATDEAIIESMIGQFPKNRDEHFEALTKVHPELAKHVIAFLVDPKGQNLSMDGMRTMKAGAKGALPMLAMFYASNVGTIEPKTKAKTSTTAQNTYLLGKVMETAAVVAPDDPRTVSWLCSAIEAKTSTDKAMATRITELRKEAVTLAQTLKPAPQMIGSLAVALEDKAVAAAAATALGNYGPEAKSALPALNKMKFDSDAMVREAVTKAIAKIDK